MKPDNDAINQTRVEELDLSLKAEGFLKRTQIYTIADLLQYTKEDLILLDAETGQEVIDTLKQKMNLELMDNDQQ